MPPALFNYGNKIEVRKRNDSVIWYPATVLRSFSSLNQIYMQYKTLNEDELTDYVNVHDVRPAQATDLHRYYKVGEDVEGFCIDEKGWRKGKVVEILENSKYMVSFEGVGQDGRFTEMEQWGLRAIKEWGDGSWVPSFRPQEVLQTKSSVSEVKSRGLILKIKFNGTASEVNFRVGMLVEVKSDEQGFSGSRFTAVIIKPLKNNKFLVEYRTLKTEDKTEFLKEEVDVSCIRPCSPVIQRVEPFDFLERVDGWYNDGWWEGHIAKVISGCKYMVHFTNSEEEMVFEHCKLRPHQEWTEGKWVAVSKINLTDVDLKSNTMKLKRKCSERTSEPTYRDGMMVEVKSDEEGYQGSWYSAVIVCSIGSENFLLEYQTLKTDNESGFLRENALGSYIRPCPPQIVRVDRYKMLEEVDVWYNDGWWVGFVSKILDSLKYAVYFWTTSEELIVEHFSLRSHQEWINGKWVVAFRKKSKLLVKNRLEKYKGPNGGMAVGANFTNEMKVEVKSDEEGYKGSWYPAVIVKSLGSRKYLVEYQTLKTDDETNMLKEESDAQCIRPYPPVIQRTDQLKLLEEVDAWYNDGWWVGQICKALEGNHYSVYFNTTNELLEFQHFEVRPHQDWINGHWILPKKGR